MHGVVSLLDTVHKQRVESLWRELADECGLVGIRATPIPHFSWQIAEDYDLARLEEALEKIARSTKPFVVRTTGLILFTGEKPVIAISVVRDAILSQIHRMVWEQIESISDDPSRFYSPDYWIPHISLAHGDLLPDKLNCSMHRLAARSLNWEFTVDNIAFLYQPEGEVCTLQQHFVLGAV